MGSVYTVIIQSTSHMSLKVYIIVIITSSLHHSINAQVFPPTSRTSRLVTSSWRWRVQMLPELMESLWSTLSGIISLRVACDRWDLGLTKVMM